MTTLPEAPENSHEEEPTPLPQNQQSAGLWLLYVGLLFVAATVLPFVLLKWLVW